MKGACSSISKLLEKYFDQEANEKERSLVENHLPTCPACRKILRSMESIRNLIKIPVEEAAQKEDFQWVWQKIERGLETEQKPSRWETWLPRVDLSPLFRKRVWIPAVAAIAILMMITAPLLLKKISSPPGPSVVEYVESPDYNVMLYQPEQAKVTVIWLLDGQEQEGPTS